MAIKKYKPTSPGRRGMTVSTFEEITTNEPYKPLTEVLKKHSGRNAHGHITTRHRGGGTAGSTGSLISSATSSAFPARSRRSNMIRTAPPASRSSPMWTVRSGTSSHRTACKSGRSMQAGSGSPIRVGNSLPLREMPPGTAIHNIELKPGRGGQFVRSAGVAAQVVAKSETVRAGAHALRRDAADRARLHGDAWAGRQY